MLDYVNGGDCSLNDALRRPLILASASPRRRDILSEAGIDFAVDVSDAEAEAENGHECASPVCAPGLPSAIAAPVCYALRAARAKALDVATRHPGQFVVGADTVVAIDGKILGKPADDEDARHMLRLLSGHANSVITALVIAYSDGEDAQVVAKDYESSDVYFRHLSEDQIRRYVATGEPSDKAGAYAVQGIGRELISRVDGSYLNVVGLPLSRLQTMLHSLGWQQDSDVANTTCEVQ